ncbi:tetratricopeptide repeat protein, partial [Acidisphaera rubrifaciens]|uniref:tetratricopeptide repeat protein n=1 Tax=Acidisphaera rubrifaciens TaxID=50715 RepID=UPI000662B234
MTPTRLRAATHRRAHATRRALCLLAALAVPGCSMPSLHLIEASPPSFVQTDNVDAPQAGPGQDVRTRRLYLSVVAGLRRQDKAGAALAFLDAFDRAYPDDPDAALLRADCLVTLGRVAEAAPIYRRLL